MFEKLLKMAVVLRAVDYLSAPLKQAAGTIEQLDNIAKRSKGIRDLGDSMQTFGKQAMIAGGVAAAALALPIRAYTQLENAQAHANVAFLTANGTDKLFKNVADEAVRLGNLLPGTTADFFEVAAAMKEGGAATSAIARGGLEAAADLKVLLRSIPGDEVGRLVATFKNSLGIAEADLVPLINILQKGAFGFGLDLTDFADTAKYFAPIAKTIGLSGIESASDLVTLAAAMSQAGIRGRTLGTSLRAVMLELPTLDAKIKKTADVAELLNRRGISLKFFDAKGQFRGFENFIGQLQKLQAFTPQERLGIMKQLFGDEAAPTLAILSQKGKAGWQEALGAMAQQPELLQRINLYLGTTANKTEAATGTFSNLMAAIGQSIGPALKFIADLGNKVFGWMTEFIQKHQALAAIGLTSVATFATIALGVGSVSLAFGTLIKLGPTAVKGFTALKGILQLGRVVMFGFVQALWAGIVGAWSFVAGTTAMAFGALRAQIATFRLMWQINGLNAALAMNPLVWIAAAIVAVIALAYLVYRYWEPISRFFRRLWDGVKNAFKAFGQWLTSWNLFDAGAHLMRTMVDGFKSMFPSWRAVIASALLMVPGGAAYAVQVAAPAAAATATAPTRATSAAAPTSRAMALPRASTVAALPASIVLSPAARTVQVPSPRMLAPAAAAVQMPSPRVLAPASAAVQLPSPRLLAPVASAVQLSAPQILAPAAAAVQLPAPRLLAPAVAVVNAAPPAAVRVTTAAQIPARAIASQVDLNARAVTPTPSPIGERRGEAVQIHYAPVVHLAPGSPKDVETAAQRALATDRDALRRMVEEALAASKARDARKNYR